MQNALITYSQAEYLRAVRCLRDVDAISSTHPNIEHYVNDSINCLLFFPMLKITDDWFIVRMRPERHEDTEEQYSYPHNKEKVGLGRANLPKEPMFYGSITDSSTDVFESSRISAMEIADKAFANGHCRMHVTMSAWRTKTPLLVYPIFHPSLYKDLLEGSNMLVSK